MLHCNFRICLQHLPGSWPDAKLLRNRNKKNEELAQRKSFKLSTPEWGWGRGKEVNIAGKITVVVCSH